ncbi:MAG: zinc finger protein [Bacteroidia bacterium]|nr:zinc finger protein [Bacteroidia bacterium]
MAIRVGRWDCHTCGTTGILGPETRCTNCGAPRPRDVKFYLPEDAEIVQDAQQEAEALRGADWICGHCHGQNKAADSTCNACGNPRDESSEDVALEERTYTTREIPRTSFERSRTLHPLEQQAQAPPRRNPILRNLLVAALVVVGAVVLLRSFPRTVQVEVTGFRWERSVQMMHYEAVAREAWDLPAGAFEVQSERAIRDYRQVLRGYETRTRTVQVQTGSERYVCGQRDRGNGYFEDVYCNRPIYENRQETYQEPVYDQVPVYGTRYRFKVMDWIAKPEYLLTAAGQDHTAVWPASPPQRDPKNWREGEKKEAYFITVRQPNGKLHEEKVGPRYWEHLAAGSKIPAKVSFLFDMWYGLSDPEIRQ